MNNEQQDKDNFEQRLDEALRSYSNVEPGPGLETRILAMVHETSGAENQKGWLWLRWAAVPFGFAVVLLAVWLWRPVTHTLPRQPAGNLTSRSTPPQAPVLKSKQEAAPKVLAVMRKNAIPDRRVPSVSHDAPKLAVFPTPLPMTEQERLLVAYLRETPRSEIIAQSKPEEVTPPEMNELQAPAPATRKSTDTK